LNRGISRELRVRGSRQGRDLARRLPEHRLRRPTSGVPAGQMRRALKFGEHTREVMTRLLRMAYSEVSALIAQGVPEESETHVH
jgi:crotonobetainyl-CoA:carnitine CoA-transferase CaiB-like acyl-CoA transferase